MFTQLKFSIFGSVVLSFVYEFFLASDSTWVLFVNFTTYTFDTNKTFLVLLMHNITHQQINAKYFLLFFYELNRNRINAKISSLSHPSFTTPHARENEAEPESPP
jgi:hypothetical protein